MQRKLSNHAWNQIFIDASLILAALSPRFKLALSIVASAASSEYSCAYNAPEQRPSLGRDARRPSEGE